MCGELKLLGKECAYRGGILEFYRDTVILPDGKTEVWDEIHHKKGGGACCVPVLPDGRILMIRQMRPVIGRETLELPAGCRDAGEEPSETARRELLEETGCLAEKMTYLLSLDTAVAWCDEKTDVFLAEELRFTGEQELDEAENIKIQICTQEELREAIREGRIRDAKTVAGVLAALLHLRGG